MPRMNSSMPFLYKCYKDNKTSVMREDWLSG